MPASLGARVARVAPVTPLRAAVWAAALALVAGVVVLGWQWRHPSAFPQAGGWGMSSHDFPVGEKLYVGMSYEKRGQHGTVTIHRVAAHVVRNSSDADVDFFVCTVDPSAGIGSIGSVRGAEIEDECLSLAPAVGARLQLNAHPRQQVVMAVANARPGRVKIVGMDLAYSHGWQTGSQRIGGELVLGSSGPGS